MSFFDKTTNERAIDILGEERFRAYATALNAMCDRMFESGHKGHLTLKSAFAHWASLGVNGGTDYSFHRDNWHRPLEVNLLQAPDLGLLHILMKEGVSLMPFASKKKLAYDRVSSQVEATGLMGFILPQALSREETVKALAMVNEALINPEFVKNEARFLTRVKELRTTNPQMRALVEQITAYSMRALLGQKSPEVVREAPLLADLMGMDVTGAISFKSWAGNQGAFKSAAESLFLNILTDKEKPTTAAESTHFSLVRQIAASLSVLPAQAMIILGEDPQQVFEVLTQKLNFLLTYRHGDNEYTQGLVQAGAKLPFMAFPQLWPALKITPRDFLGAEVGSVDLKSVPDVYENTLAIYGLGALHEHNYMCDVKRFVEVLAMQGIDMCDPQYALHLGYGAKYKVDGSHIPQTIMDELLDRTTMVGTHLPNILANTHSRGEDIKICYPHLAKAYNVGTRSKTAQMVFKQITNRTSDVRTFCNSYVNEKTAFMRFINTIHPQLFKDVFTLVLDEKPQKKSVITSLLSVDTPYTHDYEKLPAIKLGEVLEHDLGL